MSYIRKKYEELFPETTWSEEKIVANMFRHNTITEMKHDRIKLEDKTFETDEELYEYLKQLHVIPLDEIIDELSVKL